MNIKGCSSSIRHKKIKLEEGKAKVYFQNSSQEKHTRTKFDGCVVSNQTAADFVLEKKPEGQLIVELKGCDVDHACEQILQTAAYITSNNLRFGKLGALIVANRSPKFDTKIQRHQNSFRSTYKGPLRIVKHGQVLNFTDSIEF